MLLLLGVVGGHGSSCNLGQFGLDISAGAGRFRSWGSASTMLVGLDERITAAQCVRVIVVGGNSRLIVQDKATTLASRAFLGERLDQALTDALTGHLHQTKRGDLGHLMLGPVARQAFD